MLWTKQSQLEIHFIHVSAHGQVIWMKIKMHYTALDSGWSHTCTQTSQPQLDAVCQSAVHAACPSAWQSRSISEVASIRCRCGLNVKKHQFFSAVICTKHCSYTLSLTHTHEYSPCSYSSRFPWKINGGINHPGERGEDKVMVSESRQRDGRWRRGNLRQRNKRAWTIKEKVRLRRVCEREGKKAEPHSGHTKQILICKDHKYPKDRWHL